MFDMSALIDYDVWHDNWLWQIVMVVIAKFNMTRSSVVILMTAITGMTVFSLVSILRLFLYTFFFNVVPEKLFTCVEIFRIWWLSGFLTSGLWLPRSQNEVSKVLLQDTKYFLGSMNSSFVLHEPHLVKIRVTLLNVNVSIF